MKQQLDMDKIARGIGARRMGTITSSGGYFGALQLAKEVADRFQTPPSGGRATDPSWTERRLIPVSPATLRRLEEIAGRLHVAPFQVAAILLEKTVDGIPDSEVENLGRQVARARALG